MERVTRANRQPAEGAKAYANATTESEEGYVRGSPDRAIVAAAIAVAAHRSRPPYPGSAGKEPAAVVIRSPAPSFRGNPGPAVIRFPNPATVAIRRPIHGDPRNPDGTIIRNFAPLAVGIQILRSGVIGASAVNALSVADQVVAIVVPLVPVVPAAGRGHFILRVLAAALNRNGFAFANLRAARRRGNFHFALAHGYICFIWGNHVDAKTYIAFGGTDGEISGVHFGTNLAGLECRVGGFALADLHLDVFVGEIGDIRLRAIAQPENVGEIELQFSAGIVTCGNLVAGDYGRVQRGGGGIARVTTLRGYVAVNQADARNAAPGIHLGHQARCAKHCDRCHCQFRPSHTFPSHTLHDVTS